MSDFDPGEGWRPVRDDEYPETGLLRWTPDDPAAPEQYWVREESVPALPIEPGYYLATDGSVYRLKTDDEEPVWDDTFGNPQDEVDLTRALPFRAIEPRAVTAKAVLDRVRKVHHSAGDQSIPARFHNELDHIARDFGVQS